MSTATKIVLTTVGLSALATIVVAATMV